MTLDNRDKKRSGEVLYGLYETIEKIILNKRIRFQLDQQLNKLKKV